MASGNSGGSIQSSSSGGGDEEYDSPGTESNPSFLNRKPPNFAPSTSSPPFDLPHQNLTSYYSSHVIPYTQNLDLYPQTSTDPSFLYNNIDISDGMIWSAGLRSAYQANSDTLGSNQSLQASSQAKTTKNPKKRTRASRRAPTTILTTDTTNFRQMVQEFTGIPTAPFPGSPYPRRMNLLSGASPLRPGSHLEGLGPLYSLRPPSQNNIVSPFSSSSSPSIFNATMIDAIVSTTNIVPASNKASTAAAKVLGNINNSNSSSLLSDQGMLSLQHHHHHNSSAIHPSLHGRRFEASGSINFGNYLSDFHNQEINIAAEGDHLKINDDNTTVWRSGESLKNDDGIQERFLPFDGKM